MLVVMVLTWVVPAGAYERVEKDGRMLVVPGSYERVEARPLHPGHVLTAPLRGFQAAADIAGFLLLIGGAFSVVARTGAIETGLKALVRLARRRPERRAWMLPLIMTLFALGGGLFGMAEETLVFVLVTIPMARALGYDDLTGLAIPVVGAFTGFAGAFANPFTVGIAQGIAGIPLLSGMSYRWLVWGVFTAMGIWHVMQHARRVQRPMELVEGAVDEEAPARLGVRCGGVLGVMGGGLVLLVLGATRWGWYIAEMAALFLALGLAAALVGGLEAKKTIESFYDGARAMTLAAVLLGFARGLQVLAEEGRIIDTLLHAAAGTLDGWHPAVSVEAMFLLQSAVNFLVPSGSGQAVLTMPVMAPLSDLVGITRQTAVLAYQLGDGITNLIVPTSGILMALLGVAGVGYDRWVRYIGPLVLWLSVAAMLLLLPPVLWFEWR